MVTQVGSASRARSGSGNTAFRISQSLTFCLTAGLTQERSPADRVQQTAFYKEIKKVKRPSEKSVDFSFPMEVVRALAGSCVCDRTA